MTARRRGRWSLARSRAAIRESRGSGSDELFTTGKTAGKLAESLPFPVDRAVLERGQDRFRIFCTPCHGELGDGRGMIVQRGFNPPPSFHTEELRKKPVGHYFDVMTRGFGTMYSYASRIPARDRWAIAAYIRALQLSQHATGRATSRPKTGASSREWGHEHKHVGRSRARGAARSSPDADALFVGWPGTCWLRWRRGRSGRRTFFRPTWLGFSTGWGSAWAALD